MTRRAAYLKAQNRKKRHRYAWRKGDYNDQARWHMRYRNQRRWRHEGVAAAGRTLWRRAGMSEDASADMALNCGVGLAYERKKINHQ